MDKMYFKEIALASSGSGQGNSNKSSSSIKARGILTSYAILRTLPHGIVWWM
jgi:hypothetical protein